MVALDLTDLDPRARAYAEDLLAQRKDLADELRTFVESGNTECQGFRDRVSTLEFLNTELERVGALRA